MDVVRVEKTHLLRFAYDMLCSAGVDIQEASIIAEVLVWTDLVGRHGHGVQRLSAYLARLRQGLMASPCNPIFTQNSRTLCVVDGKSGFGQYLGHVSMLRAIDIAKENGVGVVGVRRSNHFGAGAYYVQLAAQQSQIGLAFSNGFPRVAPYGGVAAALGTNPFAFGAPTRSGKSVLVDLSTGAISGATIRRAAEEADPLPVGIVVDEIGRSVVDPERATQKAILPFGGAKGFCLGLMVEIVAGVITGSGVSHGVGSIYHDFENICNTGHTFVAIDISQMMPTEEFYDRMDSLIRSVKSAERADSVEEIFIPGEHRWHNYDRQLAGGIELVRRDAESLAAVAEELGLCVPW